MSTFRIYQHPTHGYQAVKLGFGWPALLFGWMWMFSKRMWELGLVWLGAQLGLVLVEAVTSQANQADLQGLMYLLVFAGRIGLAVAAGLKGNEWRVRAWSGTAMFCARQYRQERRMRRSLSSRLRPARRPARCLALHRQWPNATKRYIDRVPVSFSPAAAVALLRSPSQHYPDPQPAGR